MHTIRDEGSFLVVELTGLVTVESAIDAIRDAFSQPGYFQKNDIYIFPRELFEVSAEQLDLITQFILQNFQQGPITIKSAVVVPAGFNKSIVEVWASMADPLPYDLKVFSSYQAAEKWVTDSGN